MQIPTGSGGRSPELQAKINEATPSGAFFGKIVRFITLGTHHVKYSNGSNDVFQCQLDIELMNADFFTFNEDKGPQPWVVRKKMNYVITEKSNLFKVIMEIFSNNATVREQLLNQTFDPRYLLGRLVNINVGKKWSKDGAKAYTEMLSVGPPMNIPGSTEVFQKRPPQNPYVLFDLFGFIKKDPVQLAEFKKLYGFEQEMIFESAEIKQLGWRKDDFVDAQEMNQQSPPTPNNGQPVSGTFDQPAPSNPNAGNTGGFAQPGNYNPNAGMGNQGGPVPSGEPNGGFGPVEEDDLPF